jgi:hypothetical protein
MIPQHDIDRIRGLVNRLGTEQAAKVLGIDKGSLLMLLSGVKPGIRPNTEKVIAQALKDGAIDTVRGETRSNGPTTKRRA